MSAQSISIDPNFSLADWTSLGITEVHTDIGRAIMNAAVNRVWPSTHVAHWPAESIIVRDGARVTVTRKLWDACVASGLYDPATGQLWHDDGRLIHPEDREDDNLMTIAEYSCCDIAIEKITVKAVEQDLSSETVTLVLRFEYSGSGAYAESSAELHDSPASVLPVGFFDE